MINTINPITCTDFEKNCLLNVTHYVTSNLCFVYVYKYVLQSFSKLCYSFDIMLIKYYIRFPEHKQDAHCTLYLEERYLANKTKLCQGLLT
jgi:hypothetical protein